jgi:AcrR family transcriptional regulator
MQAVQIDEDLSHRDQKRARTHARIQQEGLRLFLERGFDAVTLDDVAAAAEVSRRTLFHYFPSKEAIALGFKDGLTPRIVAAVARRPKGEGLLEMCEHALTDMAGDYQTPQAKALARLVHDTPALRAGDHAKYEEMERTLAGALTARAGLPADDEAAHVVAVAAIGVLRQATERWLASDGLEGPEVYGKRLFAALRRAAAI